MCSEVAHLRQQITLECEALNRALYAPAITASHAVITRRYKRIDGYYDRLVVLVGEQAATDVTVGIYEAIVQ